MHLGRLRDGSRKVLEIMEIVGCEEGRYHLNPLYRFRENGRQMEGAVQGILQKEGDLICEKKLKRAGKGPKEEGCGKR